MAYQGNIKAILSLFFLLSVAETRAQVFDVTKFGAKADGRDNRGAFLSCWKAACAFKGKSTFMVPQGSFVVGPVLFKGPCTGATTLNFQIKGTVKAVPKLSAYPQPGWLTFEDVSNLVLGGGGTVDGQGAASWPLSTCPGHRMCNPLPASLKFAGVNNAQISGLHLLNSMGVHAVFLLCNHINMHDLTITAPGDSPNTDGIHIEDSKWFEITRVNIGTGDDCISIGQGASNLAVTSINCGPGHGISVGSLGKHANEHDVSNIYVKGGTITKTMNGVRIKSWAGSPPSRAYNMTFDGISMNGVSNPILIDQKYCPLTSCSSSPSRVKLNDIHFKSIKGSSASPVAVNIICSSAVPCQNVRLTDINLPFVNSTFITNSSCTHVAGGVIHSGVQVPPGCH